MIYTRNIAHIAGYLDFLQSRLKYLACIGYFFATYDTISCQQRAGCNKFVYHRMCMSQINFLVGIFGSKTVSEPCLTFGNVNIH